MKMIDKIIAWKGELLQGEMNCGRTARYINNPFGFRKLVKNPRHIEVFFDSESTNSFFVVRLGKKSG